MKNFSAVQQAFIWLASFSLKQKQQQEILKIINTSSFSKDFKNKKDQLVDVIEENTYNNMLANLNNEYLNAILEKLYLAEISVITIEDECYPMQLRSIADAPLLLYALGDTELLNTHMIAVVGSRRCSRYGEKHTENIVKGLSASGFTIVSGLAEGIDTIAAKTAINCGSRPIAVIAGGFNHVYPKSNLELFKKHKECGLILSEYPPETEIIPFMFPLRNRIMAALSKATVLTEAGKNSGALITANLAINFGKDLFVLPGNVDSKYSEGCNLLLKEMQGALVTCYEDILKALGVEIMEITNTNDENLKNASQSERSIVKLLKTGDKHIEEILENQGLTINEANILLSVLEIKGLIKKLPGNFYGV